MPTKLDFHHAGDADKVKKIDEKMLAKMFYVLKKSVCIELFLRSNYPIQLEENVVLIFSGDVKL